MKELICTAKSLKFDNHKHNYLMKKITLLFTLAIAFASVSFAVRPSASAAVVAVADVQFKVINDTGAAYDYYVNGQHLTIQNNQSVGFSYPAGTVVYKWTNNAQGAAWFTIDSDYQGKSIKLSELLQQ